MKIKVGNKKLNKIITNFVKTRFKKPDKLHACNTIVKRQKVVDTQHLVGQYNILLVIYTTFSYSLKSSVIGTLVIVLITFK